MQDINTIKFDQLQAGRELDGLISKYIFSQCPHLDIEWPPVKSDETTDPNLISYCKYCNAQIIDYTGDYAHPVGVIRSYGSYGVHLYFVAIKDSVVVSYTCQYAQVTLEKRPNWDDQLREYCKEKCIPWKEPSWYITSIFG